METQQTKPGIDARTYFLEQGQSIGRLFDTLNSSMLIGYMKRGGSMVFEFVLYIIAICIILIAIYVPTDPIGIAPTIDENTSVQIRLHRDEITLFMNLIKFTLGIASLIPVVLALVLRRNRKKRALINSAFQEVKAMKTRFDKAVKELSL